MLKIKEFIPDQKRKSAFYAFDAKEKPDHFSAVGFK